MNENMLELVLFLNVGNIKYIFLIFQIPHYSILSCKGNQKYTFAKLDIFLG